MNIISYQYLLFLFVAFIFYYVVNESWKRYVLCLSSLLFYFIGQNHYVILLLVSVLVNYTTGLLLGSGKKFRKPVFYLSLVFNVGMLVYFKYLGYWLSLINPAWSPLSSESINDLVHIILPIGISFYTFNAIGYTIDVYMQLIKPERNIAHYFTYQAFFPQVLSGPVSRSRLLLPQLKKPHTLDYDTVVSGLRLILMGYFKKIVIANSLRPSVDASFNNYNFHSGTTLLVASLLYFCQLYADFSGYTDVALGTARLFGYNLIQNFNKPFLSRSVTDFWRRWHISLSSWVRDYMYYPISYSLRQYKDIAMLCATLITFFIIGMWHGPKMNFAIFGLMMFFFITAEFYLTKVLSIFITKVPLIIRMIEIGLTFVLMSLSLILLRADTTKQALNIISKIFTDSGKLFIFNKTDLMCAGAGLILLLSAEIVSGNDELSVYIGKQNKILRWAIYILIISLLLICGTFNDASFIYYQF